MDLFTPGQRISITATEKTHTNYAGSLIGAAWIERAFRRGSGECARNFPVTQAGAGQPSPQRRACMAAADGNKATTAMGTGLVDSTRSRSTAGNPSTTTTVGSVTLTTNGANGGRMLF